MPVSSNWMSPPPTSFIYGTIDPLNLPKIFMHTFSIFSSQPRQVLRLDLAYSAAKSLYPALAKTPGSPDPPEYRTQSQISKWGFYNCRLHWRYFRQSPVLASKQTTQTWSWRIVSLTEVIIRWLNIESHTSKLPTKVNRLCYPKTHI